MTLSFGTVWLTVLHNVAGGSLLAVMVWHTLDDLASIGGGAASDLASVVVSALVVGATIVAARRFGPENLAPGPRFVVWDAAPAPPAAVVT